MPDNTPLTDAALAELDRLHKQYETSWLAIGHDLHNAYLALRQRLDDAEFKLSIQTASASMRGRSLLEAYKQIEGLQTRLEAAERERDTATDDEAGHWIGIIRSLDPENLCDVFDGLGFEENLRQWLADRDAQQRRVGAAEWLENAAREGGYYERSSEGMLEEAKQLREEK